MSLESVQKQIEAAVGIVPESPKQMARSIQTLSEVITEAVNKRGIKPVKKMASINDSLHQWRVKGGAFVPEGMVHLAPQMPAGIYNIIQTGPGELGFAPMAPVSDDLIRVQHSATDLVLDEINKFWGLREKFTEFGMIDKRGFLLYGPPGSGKSSTIALVNEQIVKEGGIVLHANRSAGTVAGMLQALRAIEPLRRIVVILEDLDNIVYQDEEACLALLDGEAQVDGVVYIATTNYLKKLPARIRNRPSRFDRLVNISKPDLAYRLAYLNSRPLPLSTEMREQWAKDCDGLSIAHIKEIIVGVFCLSLPYADVLERVKSMATEADKEAEESANLDDE